MSRHYDTLLEEKRGQYNVIVDKTWEDIPLGDLFDTSIDEETGKPYYDIEEMARKIDRGDLDYFMLRVRVFYEGVELGTDYCGGFLYEDARDVLKDGIVEDMIYTAIEEAKKEALDLKRKFQELVI
jgi:hypothetical protein